MDVIYTISGGAWFRDSLNAVAAFIASDSWTGLLIMATTLSVCAGALAYMRGHDVMQLLKWAAMYVLLTGVLLGVKRPVQVIDLSRPTEVYQVDNVPVGLVLPASIITSVGHALVVGYETIFHQPDALSYSKTGMLFGAELMGKSTDFVSTSPEISGLFSDYVQNCVTGDIFLNHKYSLHELMNTSDPFSLIFSKPSPLRGVITQAGFQTCQQAAGELQKAMGFDAKSGGKTWHYYVRQLFGGRPDANALFGELMGDSYRYFYANSQSASEIMKRNVTLNALRKGIVGYAARNGDTSSLVSLSAESSFAKMRMSQATGANLAARQLPFMQTVLTGILIGLFPVMMVLAMISVLSVQVIKGYVFTLIYLQSWPVLFAIMNNAMNFYLKSQTLGTPVTLSNLSVVQQQYSDIGTTAGWLALSIPFLAIGIVKGLGSAVSQAGSYLGSAMQSAASQSSSQTVDGTWAFNNMQTDNVQAHKWDTNSSVSDGHMTRQTATGATVTQTADGTSVFNASGGLSKLATDINYGHTESSTAQRLARESQTQAESALAGFNHATNSAFNQAKQFSQQHGNSASLTAGADSAQSASETQAVNKMLSAAHAYAQKHNISDQEGFSALMDKSQAGKVNVGLGVAGGINTRRSIVGKAVEWTTGISGKADVHGSVDYTGSSGSSDNTQQSSTGSHDTSSAQSSQEAKDFRQAMDTLKSYRSSHAASQSDNSANTQLEQLGTSISVADSQYQQYTNSLNRSHEYSQMASAAKTTSAQTNSNYAQEFVGYVQSQVPDKAEALLTDTASPALRAEREQLAGQFMEEKLRSRVDDHFNHQRAQLSEGLAVVTPGAAQGGGKAYQQGQEVIQARADAAGIRTDNAGRANSLISEENQRIDSVNNEINSAKDGIINEQKTLSQAHQNAEEKFDVSHEKAIRNQKESDPRLADLQKKIEATENKFNSDK